MSNGAGLVISMIRAVIGDYPFSVFFAFELNAEWVLYCTRIRRTCAVADKIHTLLTSRETNFERNVNGKGHGVLPLGRVFGLYPLL